MGTAPPRMPKIDLQERNLLVVEGRDEQLFFQSMIPHAGVECIQVVPVGGKTEIRPQLKALAAASGFHDVVKSLGIVRDADEHPENAFKSVRDALSATDLPVPAAPMVPTDLAPRVTVLILPGGCRKGALEDVILDSIRDHPVMGCVDEYYCCLDGKGIELPQNSSRLNKLKVHVFIGSCHGTARRLGEAASASYWRWDSPAFDEIKKFLDLVCS